MKKWKNFTIFHEKWPHWRADDVIYYASIRHRRPLDPSESQILFRLLLKPEGHRYELLVVGVFPEKSELLFKMCDSPTGRPYELSTLIEKVKNKTSKLIQKQTGERYPPFYNETFDRIVRDEGEFNDMFTCIMQEAQRQADSVGETEYPTLFVTNFDVSAAFEEVDDSPNG